MKTLILMRHTKSDWSFAQPDIDRPLNPRGIRSAGALGDWLRGKGLIPDQALVSVARRTQETFGLLALGTAPDLRCDLYDADPGAMLTTLREASGDTVLMIGHNPGICALAHMLVADAPDHPRFPDYPTGATLVAAFDIADWEMTEPGTGRALDFVVPKDLT